MLAIEDIGLNSTACRNDVMCVLKSVIIIAYSVSLT